MAHLHRNCSDQSPTKRDSKRLLVHPGLSHCSRSIAFCRQPGQATTRASAEHSSWSCIRSESHARFTQKAGESTSLRPHRPSSIWGQTSRRRFARMLSKPGHHTPILRPELAEAVHLERLRTLGRNNFHARQDRASHAEHGRIWTVRQVPRNRAQCLEPGDTTQFGCVCRQRIGFQ